MSHFQLSSWVFGYPDETLSLVFDILLRNLTMQLKDFLCTWFVAFSRLRAYFIALVFPLFRCMAFRHDFPFLYTLKYLNAFTVKLQNCLSFYACFASWKPRLCSAFHSIPFKFARCAINLLSSVMFSYVFCSQTSVSRILLLWKNWNGRLRD